MTDQLPPDELSAIAADDALLDAVTAGGAAEPEIGALLTAWRGELEAAADTSVGPMPELPPRRARWQRHVAGGVAAVVVLAASTGVAAAASGPRGPLGPLHNLIFGSEPLHRPDATVIRVVGYLDDVERQIHLHRTGISEVDRAALFAELDLADELIARDASTPDGVVKRAADLRSDLGAVPPLAVTPPAGGGPSTGPDDRGNDGGKSGDDRGSGDEGTGAGSDPSDRGSGGDGNGSDDGSGGAADHSGDGDEAGDGSGGGGGGSEDGPTRHHDGGGGSDDGSTSDRGSGEGDSDEVGNVGSADGDDAQGAGDNDEGGSDDAISHDAGSGDGGSDDGASGGS